MKKLFKWVGIAAAFLIVIVVAAALILPRVIDPNDYRERIASQLSQTLGREVRLDGPLSWSVFPWLAIEAAEVSLANAPGFSADPMVDVDQVSARVKLLPLVSGRVEVGLIVLSEPQILLEVDASGNSNWAGLAPASGDDPSQQESTKEDSTSGGFDISVAGIQIADAAIRYVDRSADLDASVTDFDLTTGAIDPSQPLDLDLSMDLAVDQMLTARISASAQGSGLLDGSAPRFSVASLNVDGQYLPASDRPMPFSLKTEQPLTLDQATSQLSARGLVLSAGSLAVRIDVSGQTSGTIEGQLTVPELNLREWLTESADIELGFSDPDALTAFGMSSAFALTGSRAELRQLEIQLDQTRITGNATLTDISVPEGNFSVAVDAIDVDRYLPEAATEDADPAQGEALTLQDLAIGRLRGELTIGELKVAGITAREVALALQTSADGVTLEPLNASLYEGLLDTRISLLPGPGSGRLTLDQKLESVQAGPLLTDLMGQQYMTGVGNLTTTLTIDDALGTNPLAGANGRISFVFEDGAILGMDVVGSLQKAAALLGSSSAAENATDEEGEGEPATRFSRIELVARIEKGVLTTEKLGLVSPLLEMDGQVVINLADMSLSGEVRPTLVDPAGLGMLEKFAGVPIPVRLSGTLDKPGVGVDPAKLALASQQQKIDRKKDELLGRLLGDDDAESETDAESDRDDDKKKLLKSLFGKDDDDG